MLSEGTTAPDFTLPGLGEPGSGDDESRGFDEFHLEAVLEDGPVLLAFYPGDFSEARTEELCSLRDIHLRHLDPSRVYGISRDSLFTHEAFAYQHNLDFPLLSDVEGIVCEDYDAKHEEKIEGQPGLAKRTLYVLDTDGTITYAWQTDDPYVSPDLDEAIEALASLES